MQIYSVVGETEDETSQSVFYNLGYRLQLIVLIIGPITRMADVSVQL